MGALAYVASPHSLQVPLRHEYWEAALLLAREGEDAERGDRLPRRAQGIYLTTGIFGGFAVTAHIDMTSQPLPTPITL